MMGRLILRTGLTGGLTGVEKVEQLRICHRFTYRKPEQLCSFL